MIRNLRHIAHVLVMPLRYCRSRVFRRTDAWDAARQRSSEEILGLIRHETHRIEKAVYNNLLETKVTVYQAKHKRVGDLLKTLEERGHFQSDPSLAWAKKVHAAFPNVEEKYVMAACASPVNLNMTRADDFLSEVSARRSVRTWASDQPDDDRLRTIARHMIEAACWAPNSGNRQALRFRVITSPSEKELLRGLKESHCVSAPLLIFVGVDKRLYGTQEYCPWLDAGAGIMQMILMAHRCGLGTCWNHFSDDLIQSRPANVVNYKKLCGELGIPAHIEPMAIVAVGKSQFVPPIPHRMAYEQHLI